MNEATIQTVGSPGGPGSVEEFRLYHTSLYSVCQVFLVFSS